MTHGQALVELERGQIRTLYVLVGEEGFLIRQFVAKLKELCLAPGGEDVDMARRDGASPAELIGLASTPPFLSERRLVLSADPQGFGTQDAGEQDAGVALWQAYLADPPPAACLVLVTVSLDRRKRLTKLFEAAGVAVECAPLRGADLDAWVSREAGGMLSPAGRWQLIARAGSDLTRLTHELDKLRTYAQGKKLTEAEVQDLVGQSVEANVFALVEAVGSGKTAEAYALLNRMLSAGEAPLAILGMLARQVRLIFQCLLLSREGRSETQLASALAVPPYVAGRLRTQARRFEPAGLEAALAKLLQADLAIKSGRDPAYTLQLVVLDLAGKGAR